MKIILILFFTLFIVQCSSKFSGKYHSSLTNNGIIIYDNNLFYAYFIPAEGPFTEFWGKWKKENDTLILNSFKKPDNYHLICIKDSVDKNLGKDSVYVEISSYDFITHINFRINGKKYFMDYTDEMINDKFSIPYKLVKVVSYSSQINTIQVASIYNHYPIYKTKNSNTNFFRFKIAKPKWERYTYQHYEYYINEKFLLMSNGLKSLGDVGITYSKVDSFPNYKMEEFISCE